MSTPERAQDVASLLCCLDHKDIAALRVFWRQRFKTPPLQTQSTNVMRFEIAWRLQAAVEGDIDRVTRRRLQHLVSTSQTKTAAQKPDAILPIGARLVREWRGEMHRVDVTADGFVHDGAVHRSLTAVARKITGVHRSGRKFFQVDGR